MNSVVLMGRLAKDPETRVSQSQVKTARYTLAVDRGGSRKTQGRDSNEPAADFIPCVAFRERAEFAEKYFRKGMRVLVAGKIRTGSYTNREGQKVHTTEIFVDDQEFADGKEQNSGGQPQPQTQTRAGQDMASEGFMQIPDSVNDDGLPFN